MSDPRETTPDLGVAICAQDSQRTIGRAIQSVQGLARRVVVVDGGSKDATVQICRDLGAEVIQEPWRGYIAQQKFAIEQCRNHQWTLQLDSDESLEPALRSSMLEVLKADDPAYQGWEVNRKIWFLGGWLHHTFQPEWRLRLFRSAAGRVEGTEPHYRIEVDGRVGRLKGDLRHDPWAGLNDLAMRHMKYAQIAGENNARGGRAMDILFRPPAALAKQLLIKRGLLDGWRGVIMAGMVANSTLLKHAFIAAKRNTNSSESIR